jgi:hypothetical protein
MFVVSVVETIEREMLHVTWSFGQLELTPQEL